MKKLIPFIFKALVLFPLLGNAQNTPDPESRIKSLGIQLITPTAPIANYVKAVRVGNMVYLSGHGPDKRGGGHITGKVGSDLTLEEARDAARLAGISLLSTLKGQIGDLNKVKRIVKVLGMVNCEADFKDHPKVINGFSDLMVAVFGEKGKHARSAVGMCSFPLNLAVEIELGVGILE